MSLDLCSSTNLGSDGTSSEYMSNGLCKTTCSAAGYAVAITQNYNCWCSNDVPEDTVLLSECSTGCPGYSQEENCGGDGVYGYVILLDPSSTVGQSLSTLAAQSLSQSLSLTLSLSLSTVAPLTAEIMSSSSRSSSSTSSRTSTSTSSLTRLTSTSTSETSQSSETTSQLPSTLATASASLLAPPSTSLETSSSTESTSLTDSLAVAVTTSVRATTVVSVTTVNGSASQLVLTRYVTEVASSTSSATSTKKLSSLSFFDSTGKVAGTFTAVGVVVVAAVSGLLYFCCFGAGRRHSDDYSDEENQYSSDEMSIGNEKAAQMRGLKPSLRGSSGLLNRNNSSKSILSLFNAVGTGAGGAAVSRSASKKRLNPKNETEGPGMMFPILEFDHRLDPATMFQTNNESKMSLADEQDYSRRILHVANPET